MMAVRNIADAQLIDPLQWYAVRMVAPGNGHRRTAMIGGDRRRVRLRDGNIVERRVPGTGERVFVPEHILRKHGFAVFLPVKKRWRRKHRFTSEQELVSFPLVADWLFVGWSKSEARWHELLALRVVSGVLGSGGKPIPIGAAHVARLMSQWGDGVPPAVRRAARAALEPGRAVRIASGPFEGIGGRVVDVGDEGARVALDLFGREAVLPFVTDDLEPEGGGKERVRGLTDAGAPACLRCDAPMALRWDREKKYHLRCGGCGAFGAVGSSSEISALDAWADHIVVPLRG